MKRSDLGGDIHNTNPSEEVNLFSQPNKFYGYPYCWSEGKLNRNPSIPGTQWLHPNFLNTNYRFAFFNFLKMLHLQNSKLKLFFKKKSSDDWCKSITNVVPPAWNLPAHAAPLDILFWYDPSFPSHYIGNAFVSFHGSWNK